MWKKHTPKMQMFWVEQAEIEEYSGVFEGEMEWKRIIVKTSFKIPSN